MTREEYERVRALEQQKNITVAQQADAVHGNVLEELGNKIRSVRAARNSIETPQENSTPQDIYNNSDKNAEQQAAPQEAAISVQEQPKTQYDNYVLNNRFDQQPQDPKSKVSNALYKSTDDLNLFKPTVNDLITSLTDDENRRTIAANFNEAVKSGKDQAAKIAERLYDLRDQSDKIDAAQQLIQGGVNPNDPRVKQIMAGVSPADYNEVQSLRSGLSSIQDNINKQRDEALKDPVIARNVGLVNSYQDASKKVADTSMLGLFKDYWSGSLGMDTNLGNKVSPISDPKTYQIAASNLKSIGFNDDAFDFNTNRALDPNIAQNTLNDVYLKTQKTRAEQEKAQVDNQLVNLYRLNTGNNVPKAVDNFVADHASFVATHLPWSSDDPNIERARKALYTKGNSLNEIIKTTGDKIRDTNNDFASAAAQGAIQPLKEANYYDLLDIGGMLGASYLKDIKQKPQSEWTPEERSAMDSYANKQNVEQTTQGMPGVDISTYARGTLDMASFAIPIAGWEKGAASLAKGARVLGEATKLEKLGAGLEVASKAISGNVYADVTKAAEDALKIKNAVTRARVAKSIGAAAQTVDATVVGAIQANTIGAGQMRQSISEDVIGTPVLGADGKYKFINTKTEDKATRDQQINQSIEYGSEGEGIAMEPALAAIGNRIPGLQALTRFKPVRELLKTTKTIQGLTGGMIQGLPGEYLEEVYGNIAKATFNTMDWHNEQGTGAVDAKQNLQTLLQLSTSMGGQHAAVFGASKLYDGVRTQVAKTNAQKGADNAFVDAYTTPYIDSDGNKTQMYSAAKKEANNILKSTKSSIARDDLSSVASSIADNQSLTDAQKKTLANSAAVNAYNKASVGRIADEAIKNTLTSNSVLTKIANHGLVLVDHDNDSSSKGGYKEMALSGSNGQIGRTGISFNPETSKFETPADENRFNSLSLRSSDLGTIENKTAYAKNTNDSLFNKAVMYQTLAKTGRLGAVLDKMEDKKYSGSSTNDIVDSEISFAKSVNDYTRLAPVLFSDEFKRLGINNETDRSNYIAARVANDAYMSDISKSGQTVVDNVVKSLSVKTLTDSDSGTLRPVADKLISKLNLNVDLNNPAILSRVAGIAVNYAAAKNADDYAVSPQSNDIDRFSASSKKQVALSFKDQIDKSTDDETKLAKAIVDSNDEKFGKDVYDTLLSSRVDSALLNGTFSRGQIRQSNLVSNGIFTNKALRGFKNGIDPASMSSVFEKHGIKLSDEDKKSVSDAAERYIASAGVKFLKGDVLSDLKGVIGREGLSESLERSRELLNDIVASIRDIRNRFDITKTEDGYKKTDRDEFSAAEKEALKKELAKRNVYTNIYKDEDKEADGTGFSVNDNNLSKYDIAAITGIDEDMVEIVGHENISESETKTTAKINSDSGLGFDATLITSKDSEKAGIDGEYSTTVEISLSDKNIKKNKFKSFVSGSISVIISDKFPDSGINPDRVLIKKVVDVDSVDGSITLSVEYKDQNGKIVYASDVTGPIRFESASSDINAIALDAVSKIYNALNHKDVIEPTVNDSENEADKPEIEQEVPMSSEPSKSQDDAEIDEDSVLGDELGENYVFDTIESVLSPSYQFPSYNGEVQAYIESLLTSSLNALSGSLTNEDWSDSGLINTIIRNVYDRCIFAGNNDRDFIYKSIDKANLLQSFIDDYYSSNIGVIRAPEGICLIDNSIVNTDILESTGLSKAVDGLISTTIYDLEDTEAGATARRFAVEFAPRLNDVKFEYEFLVKGSDDNAYHLSKETATDIISRIDSGTLKDEDVISLLSSVKILVHGNIDNRRILVGKMANLGDDIGTTINPQKLTKSDIKKAVDYQVSMIRCVANNESENTRYFATEKSASAGAVINNKDVTPCIANENMSIVKSIKNNESLTGKVFYSAEEQGVEQTDPSFRMYNMIDANKQVAATVTYRPNMAPLRVIEKDKFGVNRFIEIKGARLGESMFNIDSFIDFLYLNKGRFNSNSILINNSEGSPEEFRLADGMSVQQYINKIVNITSYGSDKRTRYMRGLFFAETKEGSLVLTYNYPKGGRLEDYDSREAATDSILLTEEDAISKSGSYIPFKDAISKYSVNMNMDSTEEGITGQFYDTSKKYVVPGIIDTEKSQGDPRTIMHAMFNEGMVVNNFGGFYIPFMYCKGINAVTNAELNEKKVVLSNQKIVDAKIANKQNSIAESVVNKSTSSDSTIEILSQNSRYKAPNGVKFNGVTSVTNFTAYKGSAGGTNNENANQFGTLIDGIVRAVFEDKLDMRAEYESASKRGDNPDAISLSDINSIFSSGSIPHIFQVSNMFDTDDAMLSMYDAISSAKKDIEAMGGVIVTRSNYAEESKLQGIQLYSEEYGLRGEADIVVVYPDGSISIIDTKTYSPGMSIAEKTAQGSPYSLQVNVYGAMANNTNGIEVKSLKILPFRVGVLLNRIKSFSYDSGLIDIPIIESFQLKAPTDSSGGHRDINVEYKDLNSYSVDNESKNEQPTSLEIDSKISEEDAFWEKVQASAMPGGDDGLTYDGEFNSDDDDKLDYTILNDRFVSTANLGATTEDKFDGARTMTPNTAASYIRDNDLSNYRFINKIMAIADMSNVSVVISSKSDAGEFNTGRTEYRDGKTTIYLYNNNISSKQQAAETLAHELIHAALITPKISNSSEWKEAQKLFNSVKDKAKDLSDLYMFKSVDEFLAEAVNGSEYDMVDKLVNTGVLSTIRRLLSDFRNKMLQLFGIDGNSSNMTLKKAQNIIVRLIDSANKTNPYYSNKPLFISFNRMNSVVKTIMDIAKFRTPEAVTVFSSIASFGRGHIDSFSKSCSIALDESKGVDSTAAMVSIFDILMSSKNFHEDAELINNITGNYRGFVDLFRDYLSDTSSVNGFDQYASIFESAKELINFGQKLSTNDQIGKYVSDLYKNGKLRGVSTYDVLSRSIHKMSTDYSNKINGCVFRTIGGSAELSSVVRNIIQWYCGNNMQNIGLNDIKSIPARSIFNAINKNRRNILSAISSTSATSSNSYVAFDTLTDILINFKDIQDIFKNELDKMYIKMNYDNEIEDVDDKKSDEEADRTFIEYTADDGEISLLGSSNHRVKFLLSSINDISADKIPKANNLTGNPEYLDLTTAYSKLMEMFRNCSTISDMNKVISENMDVPFIISFGRKFNSLSASDKMLMLNLSNSAKVKSTDAILKRNGRVEVIDSGYNRSVFAERKMASRNLNQNFGFSDDLDSAIAKFNSFSEEAKSTLNNIISSGSAFTSRSIKEVTNILNTLGFSIMESELETALGNNMQAKSNMIYISGRISDVLSHISISSKPVSVNNSDGTQSVVYPDFNDIYGNYVVGSDKKSKKQLSAYKFASIDLINKYISGRKMSSEDFILNSTGERIYTTMQHNSISSSIKKLGNDRYNNQAEHSSVNVKRMANRSYFQAYKNEVTGEWKSLSSLWSSSSPDRIHIVRDNTSQSQVRNSKSKNNDYKDRSPFDDYAERASRLASNLITIPTMADSSSHYSIEVEGRDISSMFSRSGSISLSGCQYMAKLFLSEIQAAEGAFSLWKKYTIDNKGKNTPADLNNLVTNYHLNKNREGYGRGLLLRRFSNMYNADGSIFRTDADKDIPYGNINARLEQRLNNNDYDGYLSDLADLKSYVAGFVYSSERSSSGNQGASKDDYSTIINSIRGKIRNARKVELDKMLELGMIEKEDGSYVDKDIPVNLKKITIPDVDSEDKTRKVEVNFVDDDLIDVPLKVAERIAVMNILSLSEFERFTFLDGANFSDESSANKRLKSLLSNGSEPGIDDSNPVSFDKELSDMKEEIALAKNELSSIKNNPNSTNSDFLRAVSLNTKIKYLENKYEKSVSVASSMAKEYNDILAKDSFSYIGIKSLSNSESDVNYKGTPLRELMHASISELFKDYNGSDKDSRIEAKVNERLNSYMKDGSITSTDGAAYITPRMYRAYLVKSGNYEISVLDELFRKIENGESFSPSEMKIIMTPLKLIYVDGLGFNYDENNEVHPNILKMACFPLLPSICKPGTAGGKLLDIMTKNNIDMAGDNEVEKVGQRFVHDIFNDSDSGITVNDTKIAPRNLRIQFLRKQLETDPHDHTSRDLGTQSIAVALSNVADRNITKMDGTTVTGRELAGEIFKNLEELSDIGSNGFLGEYGVVGDDGKWFISDEKLSSIVKKDAISKELGMDIVKCAELAEDGKMYYPVSLLVSSKLFESTVISRYNKYATSVETLGGSYIQVPQMLTRGLTESDALSRGSLVNGGERLKLINEHGCMDCIVSVNAFKDILEQALGKDYTFEEARSFLISNNIIGSSAGPTGIGYRIPTQSIASIPALRVKDVVDSSNGDTIILPDGYVAITGSDFDIDKLYFATRNFSYQNGLVVDMKYVLDKLDEKLANGSITKRQYDKLYPDARKKYVSSNLVDRYLDILTSREMAAFTHTSIDSSKSTFKGDKVSLGLIKDIGTNVVNNNPEYYNSLAYQIDKKAENSGSKEGIGPFALMTTNHIYAQMAGLKLNDKAKNILGVTSLHDEKSRDFVYISDWASYMVNAHVDAAKDPYILSFNINKFTWNTATLLLRAGFGAHTFYFTSQPALSKLASISQNSKSALSSKSNKSDSTRYNKSEKDFIQSLIDGLKDSIDINPSIADDEFVKLALSAFNMRKAKAELVNMKSDSIRSIRDRFFSNDNSEFDDKSGMFRNDGIRNLLGNINMYKNFKSANNSERAKFYADQLLSIYMFKKVNEVGAELNDLTRACQIDTKKFGKSRLELEAFDKKVVDVMVHPKFISNPHDMFDKTHIGHKYRNTYNTLNMFFGNATTTGERGFINVFSLAKIFSGKNKYINSSDSATISSSIEELAITPFISKYLDETNTSASDLLMSEDKNISKEYRSLISDIVNDYNDYRSGVDGSGKYITLYENGDSYIKALKFLYGDFVYNGRSKLYGIAFKDIPDGKSDIISDIKVAFEKLMDNDSSSKVMKDLFVASYFSSGLTGCKNNLFNILKTVVGSRIELNNGDKLRDYVYSHSDEIGLNGRGVIDASSVLENVASKTSISSNFDEGELEDSTIIPRLFIEGMDDYGVSTSPNGTVRFNYASPFIIMTDKKGGMFRTITRDVIGKRTTYIYKRIGIKKVQVGKKTVNKYIYVMYPSTSVINNGFVFKSHGLFALDGNDEYLSDIHNSYSYEDIVDSVIKKYYDDSLSLDFSRKTINGLDSVNSVSDVFKNTNIPSVLDDIFTDSSMYICDEKDISGDSFSNYIDQYLIISNGESLVNDAESMIADAENKGDISSIAEFINGIVDRVSTSGDVSDYNICSSVLDYIKTQSYRLGDTAGSKLMEYADNASSLIDESIVNSVNGESGGSTTVSSSVSRSISGANVDANQLGSVSDILLRIINQSSSNNESSNDSSDSSIYSIFERYSLDSIIDEHIAMDAINSIDNISDEESIKSKLSELNLDAFVEEGKYDEFVNDIIETIKRCGL